MNATQAYALSKKYTEDSLIGIGALKGAPCEIDSIVHADGVTTITFKWEALDGSIHTSDIQVYDGTPIYVWTSGNHYEIGDLAIYGSSFYRCVTPNSDLVFDSSKWNEIGGSGSDGDYDIVETASLLPASFSSADRKMYYVIDEGRFHLWNGTAWVPQEPPTISVKDIDALFA